MKWQRLSSVIGGGFFLAGLICSATLGQSATRETFTTRSPWEDPAELEHKRVELQAWLVSRQVRSALEDPLFVDVTKDDLQERIEGLRSTRRVRVGVSKALAIDFDFPETGKGPSFNRGRVPYGAVRSQKGSGYVWTVVIHSEGARALRIYFTDFELPVGAEVYVYNDTGQAFGPYTGLGPLDEGGILVAHCLRVGSDCPVALCSIAPVQVLSTTLSDC